jgi:hypothetical protein
VPRPTKHKVSIEQKESLQSLMQEVYNDALFQLKEATDEINKISVGGNPQDVSELATLAKEKGNLMKIKDSAIKIKLEVAKLHADILNKKGGEPIGGLDSDSNPLGSLDKALEQTRAIIRENKFKSEEK